MRSPPASSLLSKTFPKTEDIAIYGRKDTDIILSDDDIRIRSGARLYDESTPTLVNFNKRSPSFIKLKYYPNELLNGVKSTATIVADKINLISPQGLPFFNVTDTNEGISDEEMKKIIEKAHKLPYGDELIEFLCYFLKMFKSHTHKYHNMPPCPDSNSKIFDSLYDGTQQNLEKSLLSDNVKIN